MPTKVFAFADATLFSQSISGTVVRTKGVLNGNNSETTNISDYVAAIGLATFDMIIGPMTAEPNDTDPGPGVTGDASIGNGGTPEFEQVLDIDYLDIVTGLPEGAKIKKMVINTPCNINATIETGDWLFTSLLSLGVSGILRLTIVATAETQAISPGVDSGGGPGDLFASQIGSEIGASADYTVFDLTAGPTFITRDQFVLDYDRIKWEYFIGTEGQHEDNITGNFPPDALLNIDLFYHFELEPEWTITVTYEDAAVTWELTSPPSNRAVQPGDVLVFTPIEPNPLDPEQILTLTIQLVDADGNNVGVTVPITTWDASPTSLSFTLPDFEQEVNNQKIIISMTSTQFVGSVELQQMWVIYFYNAPGIYTLVEGRTHDTYYDRDEAAIATVDTKIPDPTGRTGYY